LGIALVLGLNSVATEGQSRRVVSLALAENDAALAAAFNGGAVRVWDTYTGRIVWMRDMPAAPTSVVLDREGTLLAAAFASGEVRVFTLKQPDAPPDVVRVGSPVSTVQFSADGTKLAIATSERVVAVQRQGGDILSTIPTGQPTVGLALLVTDDTGLTAMALTSRGRLWMCPVQKGSTCVTGSVDQFPISDDAPRTRLAGERPIRSAEFVVQQGQPKVTYLESNGRAVRAELADYAFRGRQATGYARGRSIGGAAATTFVSFADGSIVVASNRQAYVIDRSGTFAQDVELPAYSTDITALTHSRWTFALGLSDGSVEVWAHLGAFLLARAAGPSDLRPQYPPAPAPERLASPLDAGDSEILRQAKDMLVASPEDALALTLQLADPERAAGRQLAGDVEQILHSGILRSRARYKSAEPTAVRMVRANPDGQRIATLGVDGSIAMRTGAGVFERRVRPLDGTVEFIDWLLAGRAIAAVTADGTLVRLDPIALSIEKTSAGKWPRPTAFGASHDGKSLAVAYAGGLEIIDAETLVRVAVVRGADAVSTVNWSGNDDRLLVSSGRTAFVREVKTGVETARFELPAEPRIASLHSPGNSSDHDEYAAFSDGGGEASLWSLPSGTRLESVRAVDGMITALSWAPSGFSRTGYSGHASFSRGPRIAVADSGGNVVAWYVDRRGVAEALRLSVQRARVNALDWHPDGDRLITAAAPGLVTVWDAGDIKEEFDWRRGRLPPSVVAWSADGSELLYGGPPNDLDLMNLLDGMRTGIATTDLEIDAADWNDKTGRIAAVGPSGLVVWTRASASEKWDWSVRPQSGGLPAVAWNGDGTRIGVGGTDRIVRVFDAATHEEDVFGRAHRAAITHIAWSPDGRKFASSSLDWTVRIWNAYVHSQTEPVVLAGHLGGVMGVSWSPDGTRIATGGADGLLKIWDARTGHEIASVETAQTIVTQAAYSPDGRLIATTDGFGSLSIWDADARLRWSLMLSRSIPVSLAWSRDGARLAIGYGPPDNSVRIFEVAGDRLVAAARRRIVPVVEAR
jgi:WD40 repeat protein